ncbi:31182_t:CDS:2, partial [Gigaspora margarita]
HQEKSIHYKTRIKALSILSSQIFKEILNDDLVIGQLERVHLIEYLLYHDSVDDLLIFWSKKIQQMALDSVPTKKAYLLLEKTIKFSFKQSHDRQYNDLLIIDQTESWDIPQKIITLEPCEASKFQYIIGWVIYKLVKSDLLTIAYEDFIKIRLCLDALSTKNVEYESNVRFKKTTIVPGIEFVQFMYYLKLLVLQLLNKHIKYGPDILIYINNCMMNNQPLKEQFHTLLQKSYELQSDNGHGDNLRNIFLKKAYQSFTFKKDMLLEDPSLALAQLKIWAHGDGAKNVFEKAFTLSELKTLVQAFQTKPSG